MDRSIYKRLYKLVSGYWPFLVLSSLSAFIYVAFNGLSVWLTATLFNNILTDFDELKKNIQVGDPFLERLLLEACQEIGSLGLVEGMQDMGAGGLLCSSLEVVQRGRRKYDQNFEFY